MIEIIIITGLVLVILFLLFFFRKKIEWLNKEWSMKFTQAVEEQVEKNIDERLSLSRSIIRGKLLEKIAPMLKIKDFTYNPHDAMWLGSPVDFIIFDGLTTDDYIKQIVICEIKSGTSGPTDYQKKIRKSINDEKTKLQWKEFRFKLDVNKEFLFEKEEDEYEGEE